MKKAQKAISKVLGEDDGRPGSRSSGRPQSRQSSRGLPQQFDHLDDQSVSLCIRIYNQEPMRAEGASNGGSMCSAECTLCPNTADRNTTP